MKNNNNNKILINNLIKQQWIWCLILLINSFVGLNHNNIFYLFIIVTCFICMILKKYLYIILLIPSIKHHIYKNIYPINIKTNGVIYYSIKSKCRKNTYLIKIHKTENINKNIKYLNKTNGVFLHSKCKKDYFSTYKSHIYIINEKFIIETKILKSSKTPYKKLLEYIYNKVIKFTTYPAVINSLLLSIKDNSIENKPIFKIFKETGTWHLLCIGGLHFHILRRIFRLFIYIIFELSLFFNRNIPGNFLKYATYVKFIIIILYGFINGNNSNSVPTMRALGAYIIFSYFYFNNSIINHLWIFLIVIWSFLFINGNYIYDLGFQMSFLSVYFLMGFSKIFYVINKYMIHKWKKFIFIEEVINLFIINGFIGLLLMGYGFYLHKSFNIMSILANMLVIPIFYIIIILNFLGLIYGGFWQINDFIIKYVIKILNLFYNHPINVYMVFNKQELFIYGYFIFSLISGVLLFYIYYENKKTIESNLNNRFYEQYYIL